MDPNQPQSTPPEDDDELDALNEPDDTDLEEPATDGEPLDGDSVDPDDVDEIQEPLDDDDEEDELDTPVEDDDEENIDEANAFEDEQTPSPQP